MSVDITTLPNVPHLKSYVYYALPNVPHLKSDVYYALPNVPHLKSVSATYISTHGPHIKHLTCIPGVEQLAINRQVFS